MKGEKYLFVVSGPSGTGKDTVVSKLLGDHKEIKKTVSATTRAMREGEVDGVSYHFLTKEQFKQSLEADGIETEIFQVGAKPGDPGHRG